MFFFWLLCLRLWLFFILVIFLWSAVLCSNNNVRLVYYWSIIGLVLYYFVLCLTYYVLWLSILVDGLSYFHHDYMLNLSHCIVILWHSEFFFFFLGLVWLLCCVRTHDYIYVWNHFTSKLVSLLVLSWLVWQSLQQYIPLCKMIFVVIYSNGMLIEVYATLKF